MASPFSRTLRALGAEGQGSALVRLAIVVALLAGWATWFFYAGVRVYEVTPTARLEVDRAAHPIEAAATGRVVATRLELGRHVDAGEVLVELDAETERRRMEAERRRLVGLQPQVEALRRQIVAEGDVLAKARLVSQSMSEGARARKVQAEAGSRFADEEARRLGQLLTTGHLAELDALRARAEADQRQSEAQVRGLDIERVDRDQSKRESEARARFEELRRQLAQLESDTATTSAAIEVLGADIEHHRIRAPIAGTLGEVAATLQLGVVVREGERLATVVPSGELRVVADFLPPAVLGRVHAGQSARLRLDGFPWSQYGSITARVQTVASEVRNGLVRVELSVTHAPPAIALQHGLPGTLDIEVERASPATLVLRACGQLLSTSVGTSERAQ